MVLVCNTSFSQTILNESFNDTSFVPVGWYKAKIYPTNFPAYGQWERVTAGTNPTVNPHSGVAMARFDSPSAGYGTISELGTDALDLSSGASYRLKFWLYRGDNTPFQNDQLDIYINTQKNISGAVKLGNILITRMKNPTEAANGWFEYMYELPASFNSSTNHIIFRATGFSANAVYLDDVTVEAFTCNKPTNATATNVLTTSATLNWNAPASGTPLGYEWEVRTNGSAGSGAAGFVATGVTGPNVTTVQLTGLAQGIFQYFYVRSSCGNEKSAWSNAATFFTQCNPFSIPYAENFDGITTGVPVCTRVENVDGGNTWSSSVNIYGSSFSKSAPNAMVCSAPGNQNDWFYTAALSLEAGKCYQLSFAYRTYYSQSVQSMKVSLGTAQNASAMTVADLFNNASITNDYYYATAIVTFSVPSTGVYFIGFIQYASVGNGPIFIDDISVTESVGAPSGINASPIGSNTAQLNWLAPSCGAATDYEWELRTSGEVGSGAPGLANTGATTSLFNNFTGLTENKPYKFYVRSKNGAVTGPWSTGYAFQTNCSIRTLPYVENFDKVIAPALPSCVIKQNIAVPYNAWNTWLNVSYEKPNSSPNCMRFGTNNSTTAGDNWFFTPPFNFTAGKSYRLSFYYQNDIYSMPEKLEVKYGMGANAASMLSAAIFSNVDIRNAVYKKAVIDFVPSQSGVYNMGFHAFSDALRNYVYVDDIKVEETPACDVVKDLNAINITSSSAIINWTAPQAATPAGYNWEVRSAGEPGSGAAGLTSSGNLAAGALSVSVVGLNAGSNYIFYIRSNCGAQLSEWVSYTFPTSCGAATIPYTENFDGVAAPALPSCVRVEENYDRYKWNNTSGYARSAPNSLYHPYTFVSPFDDWFFTAPLQLAAGRSYRLNFYYRQEASGYTNAIEIKMGKYAQGDSMTSVPLYTNTSVNSTAYQLATINFTVPASGVFYLGFHSIISSYSYARGIAIDDISVNEVNADLKISSQSLSDTIALTSATVTANFAIANQGLLSAAPQKAYFYLSADSVLTPGANGDILLGIYDVITAIDAGTSTGILNKPLTIPCSVLPGSYKLFCVADAENVVSEINEANNSIATSIKIAKGEYWNGSVSTAWETAANWSCNLVPDANTDVIINSGSVVVHSNATVKSLWLKTGVNFTVMPGVIFTVLH
jgi:hypothetical protein